MKKIYLFLILSLGVIVSKSQTLELYDKNDVLLSYGDTVQVDSLFNVSEMIGYVKVKNVTGSQKSVLCSKQVQSVVPGSSNTFCWGLCFPPTTIVSPDPQLLDPGVMFTGFSAHYYPTNNTGISLIRYKFEVFHGDSAWIFVKFNGFTGISSNSLTYSVSAPYPNPAKNISYVNYSIPSGSKAIVQIYNICGKIEKQYALTDNNGVLAVNVNDLPSGIYFCSLNVNGKNIKTNRLIVSR
jgi:hypothetical protein